MNIGQMQNSLKCITSAAFAYSSEAALPKLIVQVQLFRVIAEKCWRSGLCVPTSIRYMTHSMCVGWGRSNSRFSSKRDHL